MPRAPLTKDEAQLERMREAAASRDVRGDQVALDRFAGQALCGILASAYTWQKGDDKPNVRTICKKAYDLASEMLYQRSIRDDLGVREEDSDEEED
jgi:hypothetical protein